MNYQKKYLLISDNPDNLSDFLQLDKKETTVVKFDNTKYNSIEDYKRELIGVRIDDLDTVILEPLYAAPFAKILRDMGYKKRLIAIPHINPYPLTEFLNMIVLNWCLTENDFLVLGSEVAKDVYHRYFKNVKIVVIPTYGINTNMFRYKDRDQSRAKLGLPKDAKLLLYTGRIYPDKNITGLMAVFRSLQSEVENVVLLLSYVKKDDKYLKAIFSKYGDKDVIVKSYNSADMPYVYSSANLFVTCSTSYFETFGRSPLEAIACGTPVIAPNWMSFPLTLPTGSGEVVKVNFFDKTIYDMYSYAMVNLAEFKDACIRTLSDTNKQNFELNPKFNTVNSRSSFIRILASPQITETFWTANANTVQEESETELTNALFQRIKCKSIDDVLSLLVNKKVKEHVIGGELQNRLFYALYTAR